MTPEARLEQANSPAILADILTPLNAALMVLEAEEHSLKRQAKLRLAELLRRVSPSEAIGLLDQLNHSREEARIRAHALLDLKQFAEARGLLKRLDESPEAEVVRARLDFLAAPSEAISRLSALLQHPQLSPETRAEALNLRGRWRAAQGDFEGGVHDFKALGKIAKEHQADLTVHLASLFEQTYQKRQDVKDLPEGSATLVDSLKKSLTSDVDCDPERLGPIPGHVHALIVKCHQAPERYVATLLLLDSLMQSADLMEDAYITLKYGLSLAKRILPSNFVPPIEIALSQLLERVGQERARALIDYDERRAQVFLKLTRPGE